MDALVEATHFPTPLQQARQEERAAAAEELRQMNAAALRIQGAWRCKLARRKMAGIKALGPQGYVEPPDLDLQGCMSNGCWAGMLDLARRQLPMFVMAVQLCFDKFLDWIVLLTWVADVDLRAGPLWWAPLASFLVFLVAGALAGFLALDEPHNLSTAGMGDKDRRFFPGRLRRYWAVALGAVGALPLSYAIGYFRLGPGSAASRGAEGGIKTVISEAGQPIYLRWIQIAHAVAQAVPQLLLQMVVGVFDDQLQVPGFNPLLALSMLSSAAAVGLSFGTAATARCLYSQPGRLYP